MNEELICYEKYIYCWLTIKAINSVVYFACFKSCNHWLSIYPCNFFQL